MNNDYSSKDFTSIYEDLLAIVEASTTLWNPRYSTEADPGVVILKAMALLEDKSNYRFDMSRAQAYLDTVSDRTSAYDLLSMLGYIMQASRAAEGFVTVTNTTDASLTIPQFSVVTNPTKEVLFFTQEEVSVESGSSKSVPVQAGTIFQVVKQGISEFTLKDIDEKGRLFLGKTNLAQNGIYVKSNVSSTKWVYLDYVLLQESSTYYTIGTSETGEMYVQFPNNFMSLIGNDKLTIYATYTDGANSNIAKNVLSTFSDNQKDASNEVLLLSAFTVTQTADIYSGQDEETIEHAIQSYYETKDVCSTLITAQDFTTALRYLLISNVRAFSNVIVETPQTKTKRMMTSQEGVSYIQLVQPNNLDYNRIDVLPTKFSAEYYQSFKPYLNYSQSTYASEKSLLETQIDEKLINQKALPIKINIAGYNAGNIDKSIQPIFATFSPTIYVYLRDNSISQQVIAREAIKRYFHTTYNMKNLSPGKPISETVVAKDIKALSTNILDVTVVPFDYTMAQFSADYLSSPSADFTPTASLDMLSSTNNAALRLSILSDAVLAGDTPLFRFANRQNSYSKTNSLYSQLSTDEQVLPVPFGVTEAGPITYFPQNCYLIATKILGADYSSSSHTITSDEMIQIRRPVFVQSQGWSQGMKWIYSLQAFTRNAPIEAHKLANRTFYLSLGGDGGLIAPVGTQFEVASEVSFEGDLTSYFETSMLPTFDGSKSTFRPEVTYTVSKQLVLKGGYLPLSDFDWTGGITPTYYLLQPGSTIESGSTYVMQEGESLVIQKASTSETLATYGAGDPILLDNITITRAPSAADILTSAMNTISLMAPKSSTISTEYVYFLCLNSSSSTKTISAGAPYTLEEGEYFIYADAGVTEYVTLGPGTELYVETGSVSLKSHNNYDISSVLPSDFEPIPVTLHANFYEITTFVSGDTVVVEKQIPFSSIFTPTGGEFKPTWRTPTSGASVTISVRLSDGTVSSYVLSDKNYSIRHLAVLRTENTGYAVASSTSFILSSKPSISGATTLAFNQPTLPTSQSRLYSSVALSGFAGSLITPHPVTCLAVDVPLVQQTVGGKTIYVEQLSDTLNSKVQGVRTTSDSTIPSPYDLSLSYEGALSANSYTTVASFSIPITATTNGTLFRFRHIGGTDDSSVKFKVAVTYKEAVTNNPVTVYLTNLSASGTGELPLSFANYVFVIPRLGPLTEPKLSVLLYSSSAYPVGGNAYSFQASIEDISILHRTEPFDAQLGLSYSTSDLPSPLGGTDTTSEAYQLLSVLSDASDRAVEVQNKMPFDWLYYSLDRVSRPLDPQSFFLPAHPKNSKVFPLYIEDATKIKFPQRG